MRGWSGIHANADAVFLLEPNIVDGLRRGVVAKLKDGESGSAFCFRLEDRIVGFDCDGDPVSSCVVVDLERTAIATAGTKPKKNGDAEAILATFKLMLDQPIPGDSEDRFGVSVVDLREAVFSAGLAADVRPTKGADEKDMKRWLDGRRKRWQRAFDKLKAEKRLSQVRDWVTGRD